jgi:type I restriction enzyme S subunit
MQSDAWIPETLGGIAGSEYGLVDGPFGSSLPASDYTEDGIPVIRGSNLSLGETRFKANEFVFVSEATAVRLSRSLCRPDDIIFTKKGTIGQTGIIPNNIGFCRFLLSSNQMKLTVDPTKAIPQFVYYVVSSESSREKILKDASVTGVPKINLGYIRTFPILLPPLDEQNRIVGTLGAIDEKIEQLVRENSTLEAIARTIYKSWFVDFDPVRAKAEGREPEGMDAATAALFPSEFEESETRIIPAGWTTSVLGDVCEVAKVGAQKADLLPNENYVGLEHIPRESWALSSWGTAEELQSGKSRFLKGDILFGKLRPYFHKVCIAPVDGVCSTDILVMRPREPEWLAFVLCHASSKELIEYATRLSNGAKMPRSSWNDLKVYKAEIPPESLAESFNRLVRPIAEKIIANVHAAATLAELRDSLLPRLISGKLRVPEAEAMLAEVL